MSLKSLFNAVTEPVSRFFENLEIQSLESQKLNAKAGFMFVATRMGGVSVSIKPEHAEAIVKTCDDRLTEIHQKRTLSLK